MRGRLLEMRAQAAQEWARLRARLPAYRGQQWAPLGEHCPLLEPLRELVDDYDPLTTSEEL